MGFDVKMISSTKLPYALLLVVAFDPRFGEETPGATPTLFCTRVLDTGRIPHTSLGYAKESR